MSAPSEDVIPIEPSEHDLSLSVNQVKKIKDLQSMSKQINEQLSSYISSVIDGQDLEGNWQMGELEGQTLTVKKA